MYILSLCAIQRSQTLIRYNWVYWYTLFYPCVPHPSTPSLYLFILALPLSFSPAQVTCSSRAWAPACTAACPSWWPPGRASRAAWRRWTSTGASPTSSTTHCSAAGRSSADAKVHPPSKPCPTRTSSTIKTTAGRPTPTPAQGVRSSCSMQTAAPSSSAHTAAPPSY